ncbi:VOC family protein [Nonomuraea sp. NPDC050680]|uniref:VOC family protein n=1 Tax=Nonomuraea sp. NPDC050680 TaxID=3154630 RepID=UPI00340BD745
MAVKIQVSFDCTDPDKLARFWAEALHYRLEEPPQGFATWQDYWRARGLPEEELTGDGGHDSVVDPAGVGPRLWFQKVPEGKVLKNRLHLDLSVTSGDRPVEVRRAQLDAEAERLVGLGATLSKVLLVEGLPDYYAITLLDPEGNEFCIS